MRLPGWARPDRLRVPGLHTRYCRIASLLQTSLVASSLLALAGKFSPGGLHYNSADFMAWNKTMVGCNLPGGLRNPNRTNRAEFRRAKRAPSKPQLKALSSPALASPATRKPTQTATRCSVCSWRVRRWVAEDIDGGLLSSGRMKPAPALHRPV